MQLGLAAARRRSAAEQEALDALCCTPPMTIDVARAAIEYMMVVGGLSGSSGSTGVSGELGGLAAAVPAGLTRQPTPPKSIDEGRTSGPRPLGLADLLHSRPPDKWCGRN
jgi:hypothetical protein